MISDESSSSGGPGIHAQSRDGNINFPTGQSYQRHAGVKSSPVSWRVGTGRWHDLSSYKMRDGHLPLDGPSLISFVSHPPKLRRLKFLGKETPDLDLTGPPISPKLPLPGAIRSQFQRPHEEDKIWGGNMCSPRGKLVAAEKWHLETETALRHLGKAAGVGGAWFGKWAGVERAGLGEH